MNILAFSHSPLSWRPLIPVVIELARRGHDITVETTRGAWRGMPRFQMAFRPRFVTGINRAVLEWVSRLDGYGKEWQEAQDGIRYARHFVPEEFDCALMTTKDMERTEALEDDINGNMIVYSVGCQHIPGIVRPEWYGVGGVNWACVSNKQLAQHAQRFVEHGVSVRPPEITDEIPTPFLPDHEFSKRHDFGKLMIGRKFIPCGFPHLDRIQAFGLTSPSRLHLIHHGGYRGLKGHAWMLRILRAANAAGYLPSVSPHGIHGWYYGGEDLQRAINRAGVRCLPVRAGWWPTVDECAAILTTGSATIYDLWSLGKRNVLVLDYIGGGRSRAFQMFPDILVKSEGDLIERLRARRVTATAPLTLEVIEAFAGTHTGRGAEIAADVVEGKA